VRKPDAVLLYPYTSPRQSCLGNDTIELTHTLKGKEHIQTPKETPCLSFSTPRKEERKKNMVSKALLQAVTTPNRICRMLNVRPILALEIQRHSIDMALITGLANQEDSVQVLDRLEWKTPNSLVIPSATTSSSPINTPSKKRKVPTPILQELSERIRYYGQGQQQGMENIGGVIVGWPIQRDTGKWGGPCGRVLYTLEALIEQHPGTISLHRPLSFWARMTPTNHNDDGSDGHHVATGSTSIHPHSEEDKWGRCPSYGRRTPPPMHIHRASKEQYAFDESLTAKDLWQNFFQFHWPELHRRRQQQQNQRPQYQQQHQQQQHHQPRQEQQQQQRSTPTYSTPRVIVSRHGGRPCTNNLISDWRGAPIVYSEQVAI